MLTSNIPLGSSVAVIGAGIVGVSSACALNQKGYHVSIYDPSNPGEGGASKANAGHIGASDIFPLSVPGIRSEERRVGKECRSRWSPYH